MAILQDWLNKKSQQPTHVLKQEKRQWEPEWNSIAIANAAGYNECQKQYEKII